MRRWPWKSRVKGVSGRGNSNCKDMKKETQGVTGMWLGEKVSLLETERKAGTGSDDNPL